MAQIRRKNLWQMLFDCANLTHRPTRLCSRQGCLPHRLEKDLVVAAAAVAAAVAVVAAVPHWLLRQAVQGCHCR